MQKRSPAAVLIFGFLTLGFYSWYWAVKTKGELNKAGAPHIPTAWIWLIPIVGTIWWYWKYSEGVEHVTKNGVGAILAFLVLWVLGPIGQAIIQSYFNKLDAAPQTQTEPVPEAPVAPVAPTATPPAPTV